MEDIKLIYPKYEEDVIINYFISKVFNKKNKSNGTFIIENEILIINWENIDIKERFTKVERVIDDNNLENDKISTYKFITNDVNNINIEIDNNIHTFLIDKNKIYDKDDISIYYFIKKIDDEKIKIKINDNYELFEINNENIYIKVTDKYNEYISIVHQTWNDSCIINKYTNFLYRSNNIDEYGTYEINDNQLTIYWNKWDKEIFINKDDIYYYYNTQIQLYHINWKDICIIDSKNIYRKSNNEDFGKFILEDNKLIIYWNKWDEELFYLFEDCYYYEKLIKNLEYKNINYTINLILNKIYYNNIECGSIIIDDDIIHIKIDNEVNNEVNNEIETFYYKYDKNNIFIFKDKFKNIIIVKKFEDIININLLNDEINSKNMKGNYSIKDNILKIYWDNFLNPEIYIKNGDKYYYKEFLRMNEKNIWLIDNKDTIKNTIKYNINYFYNYLYNDTDKIHFLEDNNIFYIIINSILKKYHLYIINSDNGSNSDSDSDDYILILDDLHNIIECDNQFNVTIYKAFNKDLINLSNNNLYLHWIKEGINQNRIFSIKSFLKKNYFFNINNYIINNNLELDKEEDAIIHFINNRSSIHFYSNEKIEIIYDNIKINNEKYISDNNKIYDNIIFIINLDYNYNIDDILQLIPKKSNIIININIPNSKLNFEDNIINNFNNLVITKSNNLINYYILEFIYKNILKNKNLNSNKIIYINNYYENIYESIINITTFNDDSVHLFNSVVNKYEYYDDYNYTFDILKFAKTKIDIIQVLIFYYIIKKNIYNLPNNNFLISFEILSKIIDNHFSKELILLF